MSNLIKTKIVSHTLITKGVYLIKIARTFEFNPGQIIGVTNNKELAPRLYSICSANTDSEIGILYQVKYDGELTPSLEKNKPGDFIYITEPHGKFIYKNEQAWWIATGTGIAPFYSMFKSGQKPLKFIHGARFIKQFYFKKEFEQLHDYVCCCSQEAGEGIYGNRLTTYIKDYDLPHNINYYLCGNAEMVVDVRNLLIAKGVSFNNIITEIYF